MTMVDLEPNELMQAQEAAACLLIANRVVELSMSDRLKSWEPELEEPVTCVFRQVHKQGGLDAIDDLLDRVNACLESLEAPYGFFAGAATEGRADRDAEFLVVTSCHLRTRTQVAYHWFSLE